MFSADDIGEPRPRGMKPELGSFPVLVVAQGKGQSDVRQVISDKGMSMDWGILASLGPDERRRVFPALNAGSSLQATLSFMKATLPIASISWRRDTLRCGSRPRWANP